MPTLLPPTVIVEQGIQAPACVILSAAGAGLSDLQIHNADFLTNFGDSGSDYNELRGPVVSHLFHEPGTYVGEVLFTTPGSATQTFTGSITIAANTRTNYYVDSETGDDENNGISDSTPFETLAALEAAISTSPNQQINIAKGSVFSAAAPTPLLTLNARGIYVTTYGSGDPPIFSRSGTYDDHAQGGSLIALGVNARDIVIEGIKFDAAQVGTGFDGTKCDGNPVAIRPNGTNAAPNKNVCVKDCTFGRIGGFVEPDDAHGIRGCTIIDCHAQSDDDNLGYFAWVRGSFWVLLGCTDIGSAVNRHKVRCNDNNFYGLTMYDCEFEPKSDATTPLNLRAGKMFHIDENLLNTGPIATGPDPTRIKQGDTVQYVKIISNKADIAPQFHTGTHFLTVFNNQFSGVTDHACLTVDSAPTVANATSPNPDSLKISKVRIQQNTFILTAVDTKGIDIGGPAPDQRNIFDVWIDGNVVTSNGGSWKPGTSGSTAACRIWIDADRVRSLSGNVWPAPTSFLGNASPDRCNIFGSSLTDPTNWKSATDWSRMPPGAVGDTYANVTLDGSHNVDAGYPAGSIIPFPAAVTAPSQPGGGGSISDIDGLQAALDAKASTEELATKITGTKTTLITSQSVAGGATANSSEITVISSKRVLLAYHAVDEFVAGGGTVSLAPPPDSGAEGLYVWTTWTGSNKVVAHVHNANGTPFTVGVDMLVI